MQNGDIVVLYKEKCPMGYSAIGTVVDGHYIQCKSEFSDIYKKIEITEDNVRPADIAEKISFISKKFSWGRVIDVVNIENEDIEKGDTSYQIIKYLDRTDKTHYYHAYINFRDTHTSYTSFDSALIGVIAKHHDEERAAFYIDRMLGI